MRIMGPPSGSRHVTQPARSPQPRIERSSAINRRSRLAGEEALEPCVVREDAFAGKPAPTQTSSYTSRISRRGRSGRSAGLPRSWRRPGPRRPPAPV
ncbi:hypothetical protein DMX08_07640 [Pseudomonas protegens]|uniref:Uncharacterized protein n=1 Tax=Pseudomonas protegens TaxID=380021 RepID=A0A9Q6IIG6_9PSED|nr:hypothetical protein DMX08_07640 [Pseudomonas protegens]